MGFLPGARRRAGLCGCCGLCRPALQLDWCIPEPRAALNTLSRDLCLFGAITPNTEENSDGEKDTTWPKAVPRLQGVG